MRQTLVPVLMVAALTSCTTVKYQSPRFAQEATVHRQAAVLPFEMILTGKIPAGLNPEDVLSIEEHESFAFQTALYHALLDRSDVGRKHRITIDLQPVDETNRILAENGLTLEETWVMPPQELAEMLGVDSVVRTRVEKTRYLSNAASWGIDVGHAVLAELTDTDLGWLLPSGITNDIFADASLLNGADGELLWKIAVQRETDWTRSANSVIEGITRRLAKKFPYRS